MPGISETVLPGLYRSALKLTRRRGALTLGRLNARAFPGGQHFRLPTGNRFFLPPDPHFFGYLHGHESHITQLIAHLVRPADICFDIGANIGYFTAQLAAICTGRGRVIAYEPDRANFGWLQRNVELARSAGYQVEAVQAAVSDRTGRRKVVQGAQSTLHTTVETSGTDPDGVNAVSVDEEIARLGITGPVRLIKVDVEGHEPGVLRGMTQTVRRGGIRHAVIEVSPGQQADEVNAILASWGDAVAGLRIWRDGAWVASDTIDLPARSDAVIDFA
ncbi:MAG: FkbM family methyltransferase [Alteraurantiacibacter sp.]